MKTSLSLTFSKTPFFSLVIVERAYENIIAEYLVAATSFLSVKKKKKSYKENHLNVDSLYRLS